MAFEQANAVLDVMLVNQSVANFLKNWASIFYHHRASWKDDDDVEDDEDVWHSSYALSILKCSPHGFEKKTVKR